MIISTVFHTLYLRLQVLKTKERNQLILCLRDLIEQINGEFGLSDACGSDH
jgi:hypothetical protein